MAGRGPAPKPAEQRRRTNSAAKLKLLEAATRRTVALPPIIDWQPQTIT
jgi:hypothetical protein